MPWWQLVDHLMPIEYEPEYEEKEQDDDELDDDTEHQQNDK